MSRSINKSLLLAAVLTALVLLLGPLGGCYYMQAASGHLELMRKREPIASLIDDPATDAATRVRLEMVLDARRFAVDELALPDNDSYRSYADLGRDFVVWNVIAAPEFSLEPKTWCFPVAGCVAYRGYFDEEDARRHAARLEADRYDVVVGGVAAYSTLGRFDDPLLNTMLRWSDRQLISTLFHELAHQRLYIKGDTAFNESFATLVGEAGLARWLSARDEPVVEEDSRRTELEPLLMRLAAEARAALAELYREPLDDEIKRARKREILVALSEQAVAEARQKGFSHAGWLSTPPNNARLASVGLYLGYLDAFRSMLRACADDFRCFYAAAEELAELPQEERTERLAAMQRDSATPPRASY